jgi:hypothetical protein
MSLVTDRMPGLESTTMRGERGHKPLHTFDVQLYNTCACVVPTVKRKQQSTCNGFMLKHFHDPN